MFKGLDKGVTAYYYSRIYPGFDGEICFDKARGHLKCFFIRCRYTLSSYRSINHSVSAVKPLLLQLNFLTENSFFSVFITTSVHFIEYFQNCSASSQLPTYPIHLDILYKSSLHRLRHSSSPKNREKKVFRLSIEADLSDVVITHVSVP